MTDLESEHRDGRQFERTALAYWRTVLAASIVAGLIVREADAGIERFVSVCVGAPVVALLLAAGLRREAQLSMYPSPLPHGPIRLFAALVFGLQLLGVMVVL